MRPAGSTARSNPGPSRGREAAKSRAWASHASAHVARGLLPIASSIPLLDASNLPSADDWALLEAIQIDVDIAGDVEPDFDRYGRLRVAASFDE